MDEFENDPDHLRSIIKNLNQKLEAKIQENHEIKLRLQQKQNIENDYKVEIESLTEELDTKKKQIKSLETQKRATPAVPNTVEKDQHIEALQDEIVVLKTEMGVLQKKLESATVAEPAERWNDTIREELSNVNNELINKETIYKEKCDHYEELIRNLNQDLEDKNRKLCHLESNVQHLREELASCKEDLEQYEGELQMTKAQMMTMQKASVEQEVDAKNERGNSLFSEVEDNRLKAMAALKNTKKNAEQAVQDLASAKLEIHALKVENLSLSRKWEEFVANNSMLSELEDTFKRNAVEKIEDFAKKTAEAETRTLKAIDELVPETFADHQWLKSYLKNHLGKENKLSATIRDLEMRLLWAEENVFQMKKKCNIQLAENVALKGQVDKLKLESHTVQMQEEATPKAILPVVEEATCAITPDREEVLKKLLNVVYSKSKKTGAKLTFAADVKTEAEEVPSVPMKQNKPKKAPIFIQTNGL